MQETLLDVREIRKYYKVPAKPFTRAGTVKAVDGVSFRIQRGRTFGLVGESGCGKTTVGNLIGGIADLDGGEIVFDGKNIESKDSGIKRNIQIIFQDPYSSLNPKKKIGWILTEPLRIYQKTGRVQMKKIVMEFLQIAGFDSSYYDKYPHELSGGQRQRVAILCALILNPQLIIADEPVSALDVSVQASILNFMKHLQQVYGLTYLFISHDLNVVQHMSDEIGVMYLGRIVEITSVNKIYSHPLHPYTKALFSVIPNVHEDESDTQQIVLRGDVPNPAQPPKGCPFHTRCPECMDICTAGEVPVLQEVQKGHWAACHLYGDTPQDREEK